MSPTGSSNIHCPNPACQKPVLSQVALAEGSRFVLRCPSCAMYVKIIVGFNRIEKRLLRELHEKAILTAEAQHDL